MKGKNGTFPVLTQQGETPNPEQPDKTALQNAVNEGKKLEQDKYTEESWRGFAEALNTAEQILEKADAKQTEIDEALKALNQAKRTVGEEKGYRTGCASDR